eukprot:TRINITY_DN8853_c0_g1_i1.p1 TRINITY_DN8853_c0_g1~~TRINITY_DN8853_c0_g1_i1.p1  ORF type:complete len:922 (+),score=315.71 TRINITY_DN8853_c0_g1_i1:115-2766(+)
MSGGQLPMLRQRRNTGGSSVEAEAAPGGGGKLPPISSAAAVSNSQQSAHGKHRGSGGGSLPRIPSQGQGPYRPPQHTPPLEGQQRNLLTRYEEELRDSYELDRLEKQLHAQEERLRLRQQLVQDRERAVRRARAGEYANITQQELQWAKHREQELLERKLREQAALAEEEHQKELELRAKRRLQAEALAQAEEERKRTQLEAERINLEEAERRQRRRQERELQLAEERRRAREERNQRAAAAAAGSPSGNAQRERVEDAHAAAEAKRELDVRREEEELAELEARLGELMRPSRTVAEIRADRIRRGLAVGHQYSPQRESRGPQLSPTAATAPASTPQPVPQSPPARVMSAPGPEAGSPQQQGAAAPRAAWQPQPPAEPLAGGGATRPQPGATQPPPAAPQPPPAAPQPAERRAPPAPQPRPPPQAEPPRQSPQPQPQPQPQPEQDAQELVPADYPGIVALSRAVMQIGLVAPTPLQTLFGCAPGAEQDELHHLRHFIAEHPSASEYPSLHLLGTMVGAGSSAPNSARDGGAPSQRAPGSALAELTAIAASVEGDRYRSLRMLTPDTGPQSDTAVGLLGGLRKGQPTLRMMDELLRHGSGLEWVVLAGGESLPQRRGLLAMLSSRVPCAKAEPSALRTLVHAVEDSGEDYSCLQWLASAVGSRPGSAAPQPRHSARWPYGLGSQLWPARSSAPRSEPPRSPRWPHTLSATQWPRGPMQPDFCFGPANWCEMCSFWDAPIMLKGVRWPTIEHYFQAQKFAGTEHEEAVRLAETCDQCVKMGRERHRPLRKDWEEVKDFVMFQAQQAKYEQNPACARRLLSTGTRPLCFRMETDKYWGTWGGEGLNMLGRVIARARMELRLRQRMHGGVLVGGLVLHDGIIPITDA